ncbi:hypothetical protein FRC08_005285 [Ceratobasidium sp. 394]|nr:hypothetical protein FRC08_005285 [Ceratobasidium sp. 394]
MATMFEFAHTLEASTTYPTKSLGAEWSVCEDTAPVTTVKHTNLENDLAKVQRWLQDAPTRLLKLQNVSLEEATDLGVKLLESGYKVKYDWRASNLTAVFRMPYQIHNCPTTWLSRCLPQLQEAVEAAARCGVPQLLDHGDGFVKTHDEAARLQPDNGIDVNLHFQNQGGDSIYYVPLPRIILETAYSQSHADVLAKAWDYLWNSDKHHIHAVIITDMSYPITQKKKFKVRIAVWTRAETGQDDLDYPFEELGDFEHEPQPVQAEPQTTGEGSDDESEEDLSPTLTSMSRDTTKADIGLSWAPQGEDKMIETTGYKVVLDEASDNPIPEHFNLGLEVFHLLRRCSQHPQEIPTPGMLELPLAPLRHIITESLDRHRSLAQPRKRKMADMPSAAQTSTSQTAGPPATTTETPPLLQAWKKQKKGRRG